MASHHSPPKEHGVWAQVGSVFRISRVSADGSLVNKVGNFVEYSLELEEQNDLVSDGMTNVFLDTLDENLSFHSAKVSLPWRISASCLQ